MLGAETKIRAQTLISLTVTVIHVTPLTLLSTPSCRFKDKRESKKLSDTPTNKDSDSTSLVDLALVSVAGAVDDQGMLQSPCSSSSVEKKKKVTSEDKPKSQTAKLLKPGSEKPTKSTDSKSSRSAANARIDELYQKWPDRFNRLEALLLARILLDKPEPTFHSESHTNPYNCSWFYFSSQASSLRYWSWCCFFY